MGEPPVYDGILAFREIDEEVADSKSGIESFGGKLAASRVIVAFAPGPILLRAATYIL